MTNNEDDKRLSEEQLDAVAGGTTQTQMPASVGGSTPFQQSNNASNGTLQGTYFTEHSAAGQSTGSTITTAQATAAAQNIYGGSGSAANNSGASNVPHVANPNQMLGSGDNQTAYNIYE